MLSWRLARLSLQKSVCFSNFNRQNVLCRAISTSKKNSDGTASASSVTSATEKVKYTWQSYGFGITPEEDRMHMHLTFFFGVTLGIMFISLYIAYSPDNLDWQQREAFMELRRREENGLPLIDPNYINPASIILPSDEELGDTEIII